jgi:hypothetical protein
MQKQNFVHYKVALHWTVVTYGIDITLCAVYNNSSFKSQAGTDNYVIYSAIQFVWYCIYPKMIIFS